MSTHILCNVIVARHFKALPGAVDLDRPLNLEASGKQAMAFRENLETRIHGDAGKGSIVVQGSSPAYRARQSLLFATLGNEFCNSPIIVPQLYPGDTRDGRLIRWAWYEYGNELGKYLSNNDVRKALSRLGKSAAEKIADSVRELDRNSKALFFTHGPLINFVALYLATLVGGGSKAEEICLGREVGEGGSFFIGHNGTAHLALYD
ncbi:MAG: hypothetical protein V4467_02265 [Patescibacteria group bacterium]